MTWTPSEGLRRSEAVVQDLLQASAAVGKHITDPVQRYRFTQIVAAALDKALADGSQAERSAGFGPDLPDFPPSAGDELPYTNGHHEEERTYTWGEGTIAEQWPTAATVTALVPGDYQPIVQDAINKEVLTEPARAPQKRSRGRPKGSVGKKRKAARAAAKAAQQAEKAEAPPATEVAPE